MEQKEKTLREHLREAGRVKTEKKSKQSALNGKLGGRPRLYVIKERSRFNSVDSGVIVNGSLQAAKLYASQIRLYDDSTLRIETVGGELIAHVNGVDNKWIDTLSNKKKEK